MKRSPVRKTDGASSLARKMAELHLVKKKKLSSKKKRAADVVNVQLEEFFSDLDLTLLLDEILTETPSTSHHESHVPVAKASEDSDASMIIEFAPIIDDKLDEDENDMASFDELFDELVFGADE